MLSVKNLCVTFFRGEALEKKVLKGVDLTLKEGDFAVVLGSNGSGKSTLFNAILGYVPTEGEVILGGRNLNKLKPYKRLRDIGIVYQDPLRGSAPHLSVEENLLLAMPKGIKRADYLAYCKKELSSYGLGLENNFKSEVRFLSGGMRQALALFLATVKKPRLLLLDEHTAALDPHASEVVMKLSEKIVLDHPQMMTLMIIHNLDLALRYGNRLIVLRKGKVALNVAGEEKRNLTKESLSAIYEAED